MDGAIQLHSGLMFDLIHPDPKRILLYDIAHSLARICRFTGHVDGFYSVAEHSVYVAQIIAGRLGDRHPAIAAGLLHDAEEAYVGDVASPLKRQLTNYGAIAEGVTEAIGIRFGIDFAAWKDVVHQVDMEMLAYEAEYFMRPKEHGTESYWNLPPIPDDIKQLLGKKVLGHLPKLAYFKFMESAGLYGVCEQ